MVNRDACFASIETNFSEDLQNAGPSIWPNATVMIQLTSIQLSGMCGTYGVSFFTIIYLRLTDPLGAMCRIGHVQ